MNEQIVCWTVGCLVTQQHAYTVVLLPHWDRSCGLNLQSHPVTQYTNTEPASPSTDPIMPWTWQGSHLSNDNDCIERRNSKCSLHCTMNCLQRVRSSSQGAIVLCANHLQHIQRLSCATCRVPNGTKGQLNSSVWHSLYHVYFSFIWLLYLLSVNGSANKKSFNKYDLSSVKLNSWAVPSYHTAHNILHVIHSLYVLHMICTQSRPHN